MLPSECNNQTILNFSHATQLTKLVDSFLLDRKVTGLAKNSIDSYRVNLMHFRRFCKAQSVLYLQEINADTLRKFLQEIGETHNPGGVHCIYRSIRAFLRWAEFEELMPASPWSRP